MSKSIHRCCCLRVKVHLWNSSPSGIVMKLALSSWQEEGGMGAAVSPINWLVFGLKMSRPQVVENLRRALEDLLRNLGMVEFSRVQEGWLGAALCGTSVGRSEEHINRLPGPGRYYSLCVPTQIQSLDIWKHLSRLYTLTYLPKTFDQTSLVESSLMPGDVSKMASQVRVPVQGGSHRQSSGQPVSL